MTTQTLGSTGRAHWLLVLAFGCATYEQVPMSGGREEPRDGEGGSGGAKGGSASKPSAGTPGNAGQTQADGGRANQEEGGAPTAGSPAGGPAHGGNSYPGAGRGGVAGMSTDGGNGGSANAHFLAWTFDTGTSDWEIRDQSPELSATLTASAGALQLVDVPFSEVKQFVDVAYTFSPAADLSGRTLHVTLARTAGSFVGVQVYAYGSAWGSPSFESLGTGSEVMLSVPVDELASKGVDATKVTRIGLKLGTGSNANGTFGKSSVQVTEVSID